MTSQDNMELKTILESILFAYGEPISLTKLAKITGTKEEDIEANLQNLKKDYQKSGLTLMEKDGYWEIGTNPKNAKYIEDMVKSDMTEELTRAAVETLTIVAYKGPITRAQIEYIRGVNSSFTIRNLLMRGLAERIENPEDQRSYLYRISFDFLKHLGLSKIEDLPKYKEFRKEKIEYTQ